MVMKMYSKAALFDWDFCPYIIIQPDEIIKSAAKDIAAVLKMYSDAYKALPVCGKMIIDLNVLTALKVWAYDCKEKNYAFILGAKTRILNQKKVRFTEIGLVDLEEGLGIKIINNTIRNGRVATEVSCRSILIKGDSK